MIDGVGCDVEVVDADVDAPGRAGGGMVIASSSPRSFPLSRSLILEVGVVAYNSNSKLSVTGT